MNYQETCEYLFNKTTSYETQGKSGYKEGLENTWALDEHFEHPHSKYATIHVAGTNGKGSVSHMLAAVLQRCGYRVGLYTSPHLIDFRERIRVNGDMISEEYVVDFVEKEKAFFEPLSPSFFELTTAMAFKYFAEQKVDIAVIEVGLGGRLDCTNIITPILSVITNISFDHTQMLGNTLVAIAGEKAGIIKHEVPVVIGESTKETRSVFETKAWEEKSPITFADIDPQVIHFKTTIDSGIKCTTAEYGEIRSDLGGAYQAKNINTVLFALQNLESQGYLMLNQKGKNNILNALNEVHKTTGLCGRWQMVNASPVTICDTGHNEGGWEYVGEQLKGWLKKGTRLHIIFGMVSDKDIEKVVEKLPKEANYYFTKANTSRALGEHVVQKIAEMHGLTGEAYPSVNQAYQAAKEAALANDMIFVGGSNYIVGEFMKECI